MTKFFSTNFLNEIKFNFELFWHVFVNKKKLWKGWGSWVLNFQKIIFWGLGALAIFIFITLKVKSFFFKKILNMDIILSFDNYCLFKGIQKIPLKEIEDNDKNLKELHFNFVQLDKIEFNLMLDLLCKNTSIRKLDLGNILYDKNNKIGNDEF